VGNGPTQPQGDGEPKGAQKSEKKERQNQIMGAPNKSPGAREATSKGAQETGKEPLGGTGMSPKGSPGRCRKVRKRNGKGRRKKMIGAPKQALGGPRKGPMGARGMAQRGPSKLGKNPQWGPNGGPRGAREWAQKDKWKGRPNQIMGLQKRP
jgi:hypothetical protein